MSFKQATSASVRRALRPLQRWFDGTGRPDRSRTGRTVGTRRFEYDPRDDDRADPGEIVWAWVSYEDDPSRGKDRPVLITARDGADLLGLYLSSGPARSPLTGSARPGGSHQSRSRPTNRRPTGPATLRSGGRGGWATLIRSGPTGHRRICQRTQRRRCHCLSISPGSRAAPESETGDEACSSSWTRSAESARG